MFEQNNASKNYPQINVNKRNNRFAFRQTRNVRAAAAEPMYQAVAADLSNLTFVLFSENWNDEDLIVLAGMAAGLPRLRTHANYAHHLPSLAINSPPINFVCYGAGERVLQPWNLVNSRAVKTVLGKLATSRNENDQYVHGFIRAVTLAFRWVLSHNNTYALSSTLFEINTIPICAPGDSNWMWRALKATTAYKGTSTSAKDGGLIKVLNKNDIFTTGIIAARILSVGMSLFFDTWNLTGTILQDWLGKRFEFLIDGQVINDLFCVNPDLETSHIYAFTVWAVGELTGLIFPLDVWYNTSWNTRASGNAYRNSPTMAQLHPNRIPYMSNPQSLSFLLLKWPSVWGVLCPIININLKDEVLPRFRAGGVTEWPSWQGTDIYDQKRLTDEVHIKVDYIHMVINALHQETDRVPRWQVWIRRPEAKDWSTNDKADLNQIRPMWVDHWGLRPGSMKPYCWRDNVQIAYGFRLAPGDVNQPVIYFLGMCLTNNELFNAGIYLPKVFVPSSHRATASSCLARLIASRGKGRVEGSKDADNGQGNE
ncbi:hypothetical protein GJ496_006389 [Pomphorhynchus laevis]|nr:hypothetical protein GJ496_006389 [Pomphorhynchus laevis]